MSKTEFALLVDEVLNEFDCKLYGLIYNSEGICEVSYTDDLETVKKLLVAYRFMNRARLRFKIMDELDLLTPVDSDELDLGGYYNE